MAHVPAPAAGDHRIGVVGGLEAVGWVRWVRSSARGWSRNPRRQSSGDPPGLRGARARRL